MFYPAVYSLFLGIVRRLSFSWLFRIFPVSQWNKLVTFDSRQETESAKLVKVWRPNRNLIKYFWSWNFFRMPSPTTSTVNLRKVKEELKWEDLMKEFTWRRFFQTLLLVFAFSFLDVFTDFRFASSVDNSSCIFNNLSSPCGGLHSYQVHNCTNSRKTNFCLRESNF